MGQYTAIDSEGYGMGELKASFAFLPWMRRGISALIGGSTNTGRHLTIPVEVSFTQNRSASVNLSLFGPAEVSGLDPRMVIRTWPVSNTYEAQPNYFPMLDFDQPDLPWR